MYPSVANGGVIMAGQAKARASRNIAQRRGEGPRRGRKRPGAHRSARAAGLFRAHERESISLAYERAAENPRVAHAMVLAVGNNGRIIP
jgi:hypothetical protein